MEARTLSRIRWTPAPGMPKNVPFIMQMEESFCKMECLILAGEELIFAVHVTDLTIPHMCLGVRTRTFPVDPDSGKRRKTQVVVQRPNQ